MNHTTTGFLNTYELDEWYQRMEDKAYEHIADDDDKHRPYWLEDDETDNLIFDDALFGVI